MGMKEDIAQAMEGCLDQIRKYAPSTTSGNPPLPDPQVLHNVADTLSDAAWTIEQEGQSQVDPEEPDEEGLHEDGEATVPTTNPF